MENVKVFEGNVELAEAVALKTVIRLHQAIAKHGDAVWVLAGGSTPLLAYNIIATKFAKKIDWKRVTIVMGDERMGPEKSPNNNWHTINQMINDLPTKKIKPDSTMTAEASADDYEKKLKRLPKQRNGLPRLDLIWLGVGPDGHTLSLFPQHAGLSPTGRLVIPVHDSPKPPTDRISLSLRALLGVTSAMIIANGKDKKEAVAAAFAGETLPITLATDVIQTHNGSVEWFVDKTAAPTD